MKSITPVILSGGSGTRLWPSSRSLHPKQFLSLVSDLSLLQQTIQRLEGFEGVKAPIVVANHEHRFIVAEHLRQMKIDESTVILEPCARNTAPAIALAALAQLEIEDSILLVLPADHLIENEQEFHSALTLAIPFCEAGKLATFGIVPENPSTEFGYIKSGLELGGGVFESAEFLEKPNQQTAEELISNGGYSWNSGIFMFKASTYISELERVAPSMVAHCRAALDSVDKDLGFLKVSESDFSMCEGVSIDYALMEKTTSSVVVPMNVGWNDIGSWRALHQVLDQDNNGNVVKGDVLLEGVNNSLIHSSEKLIAAIGVENLVLVETDDTILIADINQAKNVGRLVDKLKAVDRPESKIHRKVYRPWGNYDSIAQDEGFQVKRLLVKPGEKLSLQLHHHRSEHWVVVAGIATVFVDARQFDLAVNESTYIPVGVKHSLENRQDSDLEIIEVQTGAYLGEDDIVRYEDLYGRHKE